jgi:hypothetical protein
MGTYEKTYPSRRGLVRIGKKIVGSREAALPPVYTMIYTNILRFTILLDGDPSVEGARKKRRRDLLKDVQLTVRYDRLTAGTLSPGRAALAASIAL